MAKDKLLARRTDERRTADTVAPAFDLMTNPSGLDQPQSPAESFGQLFVEVQCRRLFVDGKCFADAEPLTRPDLILREYEARAWSDGDLRAFVLAHFDIPPAFSDDASELPQDRSLDAHIRALWNELARSPRKSSSSSSEIALEAAYIVPGGRFRELYYWDSYYTMLGLRCDGRSDLVEGMIDNFSGLIERFGFVPNGTRTYYLTRSQPPHFALMVGLGVPGSPTIAHRRLAAMRREHEFWMKGATDLDPGHAVAHAVRLADGSLLNRYWDTSREPRDESMLEDFLVADASQRDAGDVFRDLRAAAASGWDFSSRWFGSTRTLTSVRTTRIVPIDLNCLLYETERAIAYQSRLLGYASDALRYDAIARKRCGAIRRWLWCPNEERFGDYDLDANGITPIVHAGALYALFNGVATRNQAIAMARIVRDQLLAPGGLLTTLQYTGEQWDSPNGWAPLHWVGVIGLRRYGFDNLAAEVSRRWIATVGRVYQETGCLMEKYDVEKVRAGGGGEYPLQDGFGWTNGVTLALTRLYPAFADLERLRPRTVSYPSE